MNGKQLLLRLKICVFGFHLLETILKVKSTKKKRNNKKKAAKNTIKLLLKKGFHGYVIKIIDHEIR